MNPLHLFLAGGIAIGSLNLLAQPPQRERGPDVPLRQPGQPHLQGESVPPPPHLSGDRAQPPPRRGERLRQFMQELKESNPEEYDRLATMRKNDPDSFRKELRSRVKKFRRQGVKQHSPEMDAILGKLNEEEQRLVLDLIGRNRSKGPTARLSGGPNERSYRELHLLTRQYKQETDSVEKAKLFAALRKEVEGIVTDRLDAREQKINRIETELARLKAEHGQTANRKEAAVDAFLERILSKDPRRPQPESPIDSQ